MMRAMYSGVAGLKAHQVRMDVIGNNIANVNTYGFKASRVVFKDAFYQTLTAASAASTTLGGSNPSQVGYGATVGSIDLLNTRGGFSPTDNPSDIMIEGEGYFLTGINKPTGYNATNGDVKALNMTRVGRFNFDAAGSLVDTNRNVVYGFKPSGVGGVFAPADFDNVVPIEIPKDPLSVPANSAPIALTSITFAADGTITGIDAANTMITIGRLAVASVPNPSGMEALEGNNFNGKNNTGKIQAFAASTATVGKIRAGGLEMSNVDLSKEFTEMITTQRGFQANTRIITVTDEMLQELVNLKR